MTLGEVVGLMCDTLAKNLAHIFVKNLFGSGSVLTSSLPLDLHVLTVCIVFLSFRFFCRSQARISLLMLQISSVGFLPSSEASEID